MERPGVEWVVLAKFGDHGAARKAIDSLGRAGIEGGRIHTEGPPVAREARSQDTTERDARVLGRVTRPVAKGIAIGAMILGALGFIASITLGTDEPIAGISNTVIVIGASLSGALVGGTIGGLIAGIGSLDAQGDWELLLAERTGPVAVEVVAPDEQTRERALRVMRDNGGRGLDVRPLRIRRAS